MKCVDQFINSDQRVFFRDIGEMSIKCGCRRAGMAKYGLNMTKAQAVFKQMGGETVAQGMNCDFFLIPH